jgi:hypothetical protein
MEKVLGALVAFDETKTLAEVKTLDGAFHEPEQSVEWLRRMQVQGLAQIGTWPRVARSGRTWLRAGTGRETPCGRAMAGGPPVAGGATV